MLYNPKAKETSYSTSKVIADKIKKAVGHTVLMTGTKESENFIDDGYFVSPYGFYGLEMKQSQNKAIFKQVTGQKEHYPYQQVFKSSAEHGSRVYIRYDLTLKACLVYTLGDIDKSRIIRKNEHSETGNHTFQFYTVPESRCIYINLDDKEDIRTKVSQILSRLHEQGD